jgi:hypothetical protein
MLSPARSCRAFLVSLLTAISMAACLCVQIRSDDLPRADSQCTVTRPDRPNQSKTPSEAPSAISSEDDPVDDRCPGGSIHAHDAIRDIGGRLVLEQPTWSWCCFLRTRLLPSTLGARSPPLAVT